MKSAPLIPIYWESTQDQLQDSSASARNLNEESAFESLIKEAIENHSKSSAATGRPNSELLRQWSNQVMTTVNRHLLESFNISSDSETKNSPAIDWSSTLSLGLRLRELTKDDAKAVEKTRSDKDGALSDIIDKAAKTFQLPAKLIKAVIKAESNFNPKAVSPVGAKGLMQLMPETAKDLGVTDPFDPDQNVMGGSKYLRQMLNRYNGNLRMALSAYNWGPGNLERKGVENLPSETRSYLKRIAQLLQNDQSGQ